MHALLVACALAAAPHHVTIVHTHPCPLAQRPPGPGCLSGYHKCLHGYPAFCEALYRKGYNYRVHFDYPWAGNKRYTPAVGTPPWLRPAPPGHPAWPGEMLPYGESYLEDIPAEEIPAEEIPSPDPR